VPSRLIDNALIMLSFLPWLGIGTGARLPYQEKSAQRPNKFAWAQTG
jgi:hypothetical protein